MVEPKIKHKYLFTTSQRRTDLIGQFLLAKVQKRQVWFMDRFTKFPPVSEFISKIVLISFGTKACSMSSSSLYGQIIIQSSSNETQLFWTHFPRWPWVTDPEPGSCTFCQLVLRVTCQKTRILKSLLKIAQWILSANYFIKTTPI